MNKAWFALALFTALLGCKAEMKGAAPLSIKDEKMSMHCVGRHILGLPDTFTPTSTATGQFKFRAQKQDDAFEVVVRSAHLTPDKFRVEVAKRRTEIERRGSGKVDVLTLEKPLNDQATLFRVRRIDDAYISEIIFLRGGSVIRVSVDSFENQFLSAEERLIRFAAGIIELNRAGPTAGDNGFCLGGVVVTGDLEEEAGRFNFDDGVGDTLGVDIDTYAEDAEVGLLSRVSGPDSLLTKFDVHHRVLRSGERTVAGMRAQEWLGWAQVGEHQNTFAFTLETMRAAPGKNAPKIHLSLDTAQTLPDGTLTKNTMSDEQATQLWDSVVKSIHPAAG
jgi:hypothetical protein